MRACALSHNHILTARSTARSTQEPGAEDTGPQAASWQEDVPCLDTAEQTPSLPEPSRIVQINHVQIRGNGTGTIPCTGYERKGTRHTKDKEAGTHAGPSREWYFPDGS